MELDFLDGEVAVTGLAETKVVMLTRISNLVEGEQASTFRLDCIIYTNIRVHNTLRVSPYDPSETCETGAEHRLQLIQLPCNTCCMPLPGHAISCRCR
jgi:hypothetical protein